MPEMPWLESLAVFQSCHLEQVPTAHRMIGVGDHEIRAALRDMDPTSSMAKSLTEVLCLREEIGRMAVRDRPRYPRIQAAS